MRPVNVSWAEAKKDDGGGAGGGASSAANAVRAVYVSGLPQGADAGALKALFGAHGEVEEVALLAARDDPSRTRDYCFVHFRWAFRALC